MRILVYGAGVLGSYLAHGLVRGGNEVTMLARGQRLRELQQNGNVIRHYFQLRTTTDRVQLIGELQPDDKYDLIFVVMKYPDFQSVLPILAANQSRHVVIVGNNASPHEMREYLQVNSPVEKEVGFAFLMCGGWKDVGKIVSIHGKGHLVFGGLGEELSWRSVMDQAFAHSTFKLEYIKNMDEWLKSHIVMIMPLNAIPSVYGGDLRRAAKDKEVLRSAIDAVDEGHQVLEALGYTITPASQKELGGSKRKLISIGLRLLFATPVGKQLFSDKAVSEKEVLALAQAFHSLKERADIPTPNWDRLIRIDRA